MAATVHEQFTPAMNGEGSCRCATVSLPGTCGELIQGTVDGVPFLVSCPIAVYGQVTVAVGQGLGPVVAPPDAPKARAALLAALSAYGAGGQSARLCIASPLPRSKGLGSSTADVGGALAATAAALGQTLEAQAVARLATAIEPSDSTLFPGLVLFDHRAGTLYEPLGPAPELAVLVLDGGGEVDTLEYNRRDHRAALRRLAPQHREALQVLRAGLRTGDLAAIGHAATLSALAHQAILPKPALPAVIALARDLGAWGVNVAHSGTVIGILLAAGADLNDAERYVRHKLPSLRLLYATHLVGGGPRHHDAAHQEDSRQQNT
ncbi:MAG: GHMP family kinase ATP-binding protein, partial [Anaerolineae bacterium]